MPLSTVHIQALNVLLPQDVQCRGSARVFLALLLMAVHFVSCVPEYTGESRVNIGVGKPWKMEVKLIGACRDVGCLRSTFSVFRWCTCFYSLALLHQVFYESFLYSHICCLIHTCIFYLYMSVDYLQGRSASVPGEIPVSPFFETSDVCVHFCAFFCTPF